RSVLPSPLKSPVNHCEFPAEAFVETQPPCPVAQRCITKLEPVEWWTSADMSLPRGLMPLQTFATSILPSPSQWPLNHSKLPAEAFVEIQPPCPVAQRSRVSPLVPCSYQNVSGGSALVPSRPYS